MAATPPAAPSVTEYNIRVPKNQKKKYQVMRYNSSLKIDFQKWSQVKMERENNMREFKGPDEEQPKFGAGSEFGRDAREEARRKKFGIVSKRYKTEAQPWLIKVKQAGKNFGYRGVREGGIAENAAYYVFTHAPDGGIDAYPLQEWYNFQPVQRYKALSAEEAEEEFGRRNKLMNYFSVMTRKRCRGKDDDAELDDPDEVKLKKGGAKKKELKISDMDDWMDSSDEDDESGSEKEEKESEEQKEEKEKKKKQKEKAKNLKKKKKKHDPDDEAFEESDDGDEEGREVDYISDSSDSESDHEGQANKQLKGVSEEKALRNLLSSGSEDEEEKEAGDKEKESDQEEKEGDKGKEGEGAKEEGKEKGKEGKKKKKKKKALEKKAVKKEDAKAASSSEFSSDSDTDSEMEAKRKAKREKGAKEAKDSRDAKDAKETKEVKEVKESTSGGSSRSATPTKEGKEAAESSKRKMAATPEPPGLSKKQRLDNFASAPFTASPIASNEAGITEDAVRRYLMRKPMTTTELLQKFKSKKTGLSSDQLVNVMTQILKRINPIKQTIKGKMYLSIKR